MKAGVPFRWAWDRARDTWRRLRGWRRLSFTATGVVFTLGTLAVGFAAVNTGSNLLHLLLGAMFGLLVVSGWLSERTLRGIEVVRRVPRGTPVDRDVRIHYRVRNRKRRLPSYALELREPGLPVRAYVHRVGPGEETSARSANRFIRRGIHALPVLTLSTTFPFGLFRKERDLPLAGELVIWPATDRKVHLPARAGGRRPRRMGGTARAATSGQRGEYQGLREYRAGDPARDIHWRRSARLRTPVVREYEPEGADGFWICLDTSVPPGDPAEEAAEIAASLASAAVQGGRRFGLATPHRTLAPGAGPRHLEGVLDALARVDFVTDDPPPVVPADPGRCVLVTADARQSGPFGDVRRPTAEVVP